MPARKRKPPPQVTISKHATGTRVPRRRLRRLIEFVAEAEGQTIAAVDLAVVGDAEIAALNRRHLGRGGATDVLSFDLSDAAHTGIVAQIVVSGDRAARQAQLRGHAAGRELMLYVVHGLLHLMGYDDSSVRGGARMHAREDKLLAAFGAGATYARKPRRRPK